MATRHPGRSFARHAAINAATVLVAVLVATMAMEVAVRVWRGRVRPDLERRMTIPKPQGDSAQQPFRILAVGGSSMVGEPYQLRFQFPDIITKYLRDAYPGRTFAVEYLSRGGATLRELYSEALGALKRRPSLLLVMSGHNEAIGDFAHNQACTQKERALYSRLRGSALFRLLWKRFKRRGIETLPEPTERAFFDLPIVCAEHWDDIMAEYAKATLSLARIGQDNGIPVVLVFPAGNEAGFNPNRSVYRGAPSEREELWREYLCARQALDSGALDEADSCLARARAIDPRFAEVLYQSGKLALRQGHLDEARELFKKAKDEDVFPWRALSEQKKAIDEAARRFGAVALDAREIIMAASPSGLLDSTVFHDMHHPTIAGYNAVAVAIVGEIIRRGLGGLPKKTPPSPMGTEELLRFFRFSSGDWYDVFRSRSQWLKRVADVTFEPTERLELLLDNLRTLEEIDTPAFYRQLGGKVFIKTARNMLKAARSRLALPIDDESVSKGESLRRWLPYVAIHDEWPLTISGISSSIRHGSGHIMNGRGPDALPIEVNGKTVDNGFGMWPPAEVAFPLGGKTGTFQSQLVVRGEEASPGRATCLLYGDGREIGRYERVRVGQPARRVHVDLEGVQDLRIICHDAGVGSFGDQILWLNPSFQ